ncbi:hypothetical protein AMECASPLE_032273 [Ameca splendens]|uniref:Uncharacterized protein n=1 Tax=Ameca splendens TaxID=208324 RepID=A0ABV0YTI0_9TELE
MLVDGTLKRLTGSEVAKRRNSGSCGEGGRERSGGKADVKEANIRGGGFTPHRTSQLLRTSPPGGCKVSFYFWTRNWTAPLSSCSAVSFGAESGSSTQGLLATVEAVQLQT